MLLTMALTEAETADYRGAIRTAIKADARIAAAKRGRRYAQVVGSDGRILDVVEVCT